MEGYNDNAHHECTTNYSFTHVNFVWNVAHMRFFTSWACEFLNWQISAKAKGLSFGKIYTNGKFTPTKITHYMTCKIQTL